MSSYSCRRCRAELPAYLHRELAPHRRRRVSQHLSACAACYAHYRDLGDLDRDLGAKLARPGMPDRTQLARLWSGIQSDMRAARSPSYHRGRMRYGLAAAMLVLALALPYTFNQGHALALPVPPTPRVMTGIAETQPRQVVMATPVGANLRVSSIDSTPAFERNDPPVLLVTDTP